MTRSLLLLLAFLLQISAAELPVRRVILYKHGVGYFERSGELRPGEAARLDFKSSEMNDVLKSLTISDTTGNKISGVRYDSSEPLSRKLSEFPFNIGDHKPLSVFLDSLKGARVELRFGPETAAGAIVGARLSPATETQPERQQITLLLDTGVLRTLDLSGATELRFQDSELQQQLREYLAALSSARSREKRSVYIDSADSQVRKLIAGYIIPVPVWKSSYRLSLAAGGEPLLEGWAIVDNVTGDDWSKVQLSLVSGRPISFISRLYEPRYITRPVAELPEEQAQAPALHEGGVGVVGGVAGGVAGGVIGGIMSSQPAARQKALRDGARFGAMAAPAPEEAMVARSEIASSVTGIEGRELGELFEYGFAAPVTVRKGESAMLPFLQQRITARKLLIYADSSSVHPSNAVEITNNTGKTLDGGPVTVFDAGAYGGEALMETLKSSDKRLVSYGVDLGTRISTKLDSGRDDLREVHFRRGVLTARRAIRETRTYTIRNVEQKAKALIVEHPIRPNYKLIEAKPAETTSSAYRFEVKLAPGATEKYPVVEERILENVFAVTNLTPDVLASFLQNKELPAATRKSLEQLARLKRQVADTDGAINNAQLESNDLNRDQERLRQNINSLRMVTGQQEQVQIYARQLAANESQIASLRDRIGELRKKKAALESELNSLIETMEF